MIIKIDYTPEDIHEAQKLHYYRSKYRYFFCSLALIMVAGIFFLDMPVGQIIFSSVFALFLIFYPYILKYCAKTSFKQMPAFQSTINFEIDERGIRTNSAVGSTNHTWNAFTYSKNNYAGLLLYLGPGLFNFIPKRVVSDEGWENLLKLVNSNLSRHEPMGQLAKVSTALLLISFLSTASLFLMVAVDLKDSPLITLIFTTLTASFVFGLIFWFTTRKEKTLNKTFIRVRLWAFWLNVAILGIVLLLG